MAGGGHTDCYWNIKLFHHGSQINGLYFLSLKGRHASQDELAASAFQAVSLDQKYNDEPVQVRVTMGKEPRHFMAIFKGKMVIFVVRQGRRLMKQSDFRSQVYVWYDPFFLIREVHLGKAPLNLHLQ